MLAGLDTSERTDKHAGTALENQTRKQPQNHWPSSLEYPPTHVFSSRIPTVHHNIHRNAVDHEHDHVQVQS